MCAADYVWQSSHGMKVPLNLYLFDSGVCEFDVLWVINWWELRVLMTKGSARLTEDWGTSDLSFPSERFPWPRVVRTWMCGGIGFDRRVSLSSCGSSKLHICSSTVLGNLNRDVSHSSVSARISTLSRKKLSLQRAWASSLKSLVQICSYEWFLHEAQCSYVENLLCNILSLCNSA